MGSQSARALARGLGVLRVRDTYVPKRRDLIINWGKSNLQTRYPLQVINHPDAVRIAANKLLTYQLLKLKDFESRPEWTTSIIEASDWIEDSYKVYCRTQLTGHSGSGIVIASTSDELVHAPLYTRSIKYKYEYRVHVFQGRLLDVQQKKKRLNWEGNSIQGIRNASNGWVYARDNVECSALVTDAAIEAVNILGLDFGAVDIGYNQHEDKCYLFEVNTAPGLEGTTLIKYIQAFKELL
jgi:glutathione synthase/RimK-type ligase-like ATP-grasp enzyme